MEIKRLGKEILLTIGGDVNLDDLVEGLFWEDLYLETGLGEAYIVDYKNMAVYDIDIIPWRGDYDHIGALRNKVTRLYPWDEEASREIIEEIEEYCY